MIKMPVKRIRDEMRMRDRFYDSETGREINSEEYLYRIQAENADRARGQAMNTNPMTLIGREAYNNDTMPMHDHVQIQNPPKCSGSGGAPAITGLSANETLLLLDEEDL